MHSSGINMRYLGTMIEKSREQWLQSLLLSEVVARSAKWFLRYDMQETALGLGVDSVERAEEYQKGQVVTWMNKLFGVGLES